MGVGEVVGCGGSAFTAWDEQSMVVSCRFIAGVSYRDFPLPFVSSFLYLNLFPLLLLYASMKGTLNPL